MTGKRAKSAERTSFGTPGTTETLGALHSPPVASGELCRLLSSTPFQSSSGECRFKRIKNFACVEFRPQASKILVYVKVDPDSVSLQEGFTRDVSNIGHYGTGDLEITLSTPDDLERAMPLIRRSYEVS